MLGLSATIHTSKSPAVETKRPEDAGHDWPTEPEPGYPTPGRFWRATVFVLKLAVIGAVGYGAALYLGIL